MCEHKFDWQEGQKADKIWKVNKCILCGEIEDVTIKEVIANDPKNGYFRLMYHCVDSVREHYAYLPEEQKMSCAISLFIKLSNMGVKA